MGGGKEHSRSSEEALVEWGKLLGRERQAGVAGEHGLGGQRHGLES